MLTKLVSLVTGGGHTGGGTSATNDGELFHDLSSEADSDSPDAPVLEAALYKLSGLEVNLVRPRAQLQLTLSGVAIGDDIAASYGADDATADCMEFEYTTLLSVRQHRPESIQFVVADGGENKEWGIHFDDCESALRFRRDLMNEIAETCEDVLANCEVTAHRITGAEAVGQENKGLVITAIASVRQREKDSLTLLTLGDVLAVELCRDLQLEIIDVPRGELIFWGPFELDPETREWQRVWWRFLGVTEGMLMVMSRSFGVEERILMKSDCTTSKELDAEEVRWDDLRELDHEIEQSRRLHDPVDDSDEGEAADVAAIEEEALSDCRSARSESFRGQADLSLGTHKFMEVGNSHSFICRAQDVAEGWNPKAEHDYELHVLSHNEHDTTGAVITGDKFTYQSKTVNPTKGLLPHDDHRLIFVDDKNPDAVYQFDVEREKVVSKFGTAGMPAQLLWKRVKGEQSDSFMAGSKNSFYLMDTRLAEANVTAGRSLDEQIARSHTRAYKTNTNFTAAASDARGHIAIGSNDGVVRLYDGKPNDSGDFKIAKTQLNSRPEMIKSLDTTDDGSWVLATMKSCLLLYPTKLKGSEKTGFETRLGVNRPDPLVLRISNTDIREYKLADVDFQPAVFDEAQQTIVTSTGALAIVWDFQAIKKGKTRNIYSIKKLTQVIQETKTTGDGKILIAHPHHVEVLSTRRNAPRRNPD